MAFVTLLERKLLGLSQIRLGPNKTRLVGVLQPVRDGIKLLAKTLVLLFEVQLTIEVGSTLLLMLLLMLI